MPYNESTNQITRVGQFVDLYAAGQVAMRSQFDAHLNDLVASINASIADVQDDISNREITSFADLATKFVYADPDIGQVAVAANDIIVWRERGFAYKVLPVPATDQHFDYTGAGGIKLKAMPCGAEGYVWDAFGAKADGSDDWDAIQASINFAARDRVGKSTGLAGSYFVTKTIRLHYDAVNNPSYPTDEYRRGRIIVEGVDRSSHSNPVNANNTATTIVSSVANAPTFLCEGDPLNDGSFRTDNVEILNLTIQASSSTSVMRFNKVAQNSKVRDVLVYQAGAGGGVEWRNTWLARMENVYVRGNLGVSLGKGIEITNDQSGVWGGIVLLENVTVARFSVIGWQLGDESYNTGKRLYAIDMVGCQAADCGAGFIFGDGIDSVKLVGCHAESCAVAAQVLFECHLVDFDTFSVGQCVRGVVLGDGSDTNRDRWGNVTIQNSYFRSGDTTTNHIEVFQHSSGTGGLVMRNNHHFGDPDATDTAIWVEDVFHKRIELVNPDFKGTLTTQITNAHRIQIYEAQESIVWRANNTGGTKTAPPFQIRSESSSAAQAVLGVHQRDVDEPFLQLSTTATPGGSMNHITTTKGSGTVLGPGNSAWVFSYMLMAAELVHAGGTEDVWIPVFKPV